MITKNELFMTCKVLEPLEKCILQFILKRFPNHMSKNELKQLILNQEFINDIKTQWTEYSNNIIDILLDRMLDCFN